MKGREAGRLLLDYCAGSLMAERVTLLEAHIEDCRECREAVTAQNSVWQALDAWEPVAVSPDFNRRLYARIEEEDRTQSPLRLWLRGFAVRWSPFPWRAAVPVAAACVALVAVLLIEPLVPVHSPARDDSAAKVERIDAEQLERTLDDLEMLKQLSPRISESGSSHPI